MCPCFDSRLAGTAAAACYCYVMPFGSFNQPTPLSRAQRQVLDTHAVALPAGLRSLWLGFTPLDELSSPDPVLHIFPALPALTALTSISVAVLRACGHLQCMPQVHTIQLNILRELDPGAPAVLQQQWRADPELLLPLGHLTACTQLEIDHSLWLEDVLPPRLVSLKVADMLSVQPLLQLRQLQALYVSNSSTPAAELQKLGTISSSRSSSFGSSSSSGGSRLSEVTLVYKDPKLAVNAAAAWPALPVCLLSITDHRDDEENEYCMRMPTTTLQQLSKLQTLEALELGEVEVCPAASMALVDALGQLTGLKGLALNAAHIECLASQVGEGNASGAAAAADDAMAGAGEPAAGSVMQAVIHAICKIPSLNTLCLETGSNTAAAAAVELLAQATQLTGLHLANNQLDPFTYNTIICSLSRLEALTVADDVGFGDGHLPVICRMLPGLTRVSLAGTGVTERGVACLRQHLRRLQHLDVSDTAVIELTG